MTGVRSSETWDEGQIEDRTIQPDDLYRIDGKAELVGGNVIRFPPAGHLQNRIAGRLCRSLDDHATRIERGVACSATMAFIVPTLISGRQSFSPDASYYDGPLPANLMRFIEGPPTLAVEVRSESDYSPSAEREMAAKRRDYFEAGTPIVWDVDPVAETIAVYRSANPDVPTIYTRGQATEAGPAVPGWVVDVEWVFG